MLKDMLEVADNLERAAAAVEGAPDIKALQQGVALVLRLFQSKLERYDVKPLEAKGQPFDPRLHDAISQVPSAEAPPGSVLNEVQKGYRIGDRLLRPAMVVVAVAPLRRPRRQAQRLGGRRLRQGLIFPRGTHHRHRSRHDQLLRRDRRGLRARRHPQRRGARAPPPRWWDSGRAASPWSVRSPSARR